MMDDNLSKTIKNHHKRGKSNNVSVSKKMKINESLNGSRHA
jgi:hypothetical protein